MIFIYNAVMNMEIYGNMADNCRKCIFAKNYQPYFHVYYYIGNISCLSSENHT